MKQQAQFECDRIQACWTFANISIVDQLYTIGRYKNILAVKVTMTACPSSLYSQIFELSNPVEIKCIPNLVEDLVIEKPLPYLSDRHARLWHSVDPPCHRSFHAVNNGFSSFREISRNIENTFVRSLGKAKKYPCQFMRAIFQGS